MITAAGKSNLLLITLSLYGEYIYIRLSIKVFVVSKWIVTANIGGKPNA